MDTNHQLQPTSEHAAPAAASQSWTAPARLVVMERTHGDPRHFVSVKFVGTASPPELQERLAALALLPPVRLLRERLPNAEAVVALAALKKTIAEHPELQHILAAHGQEL